MRNERATGVFSCVVDTDPRFHLEVLRWFATLTDLSGVVPGDLFVHVVGGGSSDALDYLEAQGVHIRAVDVFDPRSPHCNKIAGALGLSKEDIGELAVLTDTDVVVLEDVRVLQIPDGAIALKTVDAPNPPLEVVSRVFDEAGVARPPLVPVPSHPGARTFAGNGNGGVYVLRSQMLAPLAEEWARWATWLLDRPELLDRWAIHVDQVSMALAIASSGTQPILLDIRWNLPTHVPRWVPSNAPAPAVVHYHDRVDQAGFLVPVGVAAVDGRLSQANAAIRRLWQDAFPNGTFWEWRYRSNPELGSGVGSRGESLRGKRELISSVVDLLHASVVLDVGCGDGEATRDLELGHYVGMDLSPAALESARAARPDGDFRLGTLPTGGVASELTVCLDVLIHQAVADQYEGLVAGLVCSAAAVLVSGYEAAPTSGSAMVHFHEPLSVTLRRFAPGAELFPLRHDRETTTFLVLQGPADRHPRDFGPVTLAPLTARHPNVWRLLQLRVSAWGTTGFYPDHAPRLYEYPAVVDVICSRVQPGSRVLDVGAGVTPIVPFLTGMGYVVDTVDPSPQPRSWPVASDANEWGFIDYAAAGFARRSWNTTVEELPPSAAFDAVYSVSVIEHLPAATRRRLLHELAVRLRPGGLTILTVDLLRGSDDLWNRSEGVQVEPAEHHGSMQDLLSEAAAEGLSPCIVEAVRRWGDVPVDIGMLVFRRSD